MRTSKIEVRMNYKYTKFAWSPRNITCYTYLLVTKLNSYYYYSFHTYLEKYNLLGDFWES